MVTQFINTAIIYYILAWTTTDPTNPDASILGTEGLVVKVMSLVAVSGVIQIGMNAAQIGSLITWAMNYFKYKPGETYNLFQVHLNKALELPEFDFADRYSYYLINIFVISFYAYITPMTTPIMALIFFVQYWVDKFNLFKRFSCPVNFDYRLSQGILKLFDFSLILFALGNFVFAPDVHETAWQWTAINIITLCISTIYCILIAFMPKKW